MPNRRMFSNRIANSAKFLQMPAESQLLYMHMVLRADDDGVVESYPVMKLLGIAPDNFKVLVAKGFIRQLNEDQVIVITDWLEHNTIRADRKVDSIYKNLLVQQFPDIKLIESKPRSDLAKNRQKKPRTVHGQSTDGISKVKLSKDKLRQDNKTISNEIEAKAFGNEKVNWLISEFTKTIGFEPSGKKAKDRQMAMHLIKNYTEPQIKAMLKFCAQDDYLRIGSIEKLWYKRGDIIAGIKKIQNTNKPLIVKQY